MSRKTFKLSIFQAQSIIKQEALKMNSRLILATIIVLLKLRESFSSKYEIILEKVETALGNDDKVLMFTTLRVKKFNHTTYVVNGKYSILRPFDDSMNISGAALNFQGGQYKKMFDKVVETPPTTLYGKSEFQLYFENFQRSQKIQIPWLTNPYPSGDNEITNLAVEDYGSMLPPYLPGGEKWKFEIKFYENEELLGGFNIYATIRNQRSLMEGK